MNGICTNTYTHILKLVVIFGIVCTKNYHDKCTHADVRHIYIYVCVLAYATTK